MIGFLVFNCLAQGSPTGKLHKQWQMFFANKLSDEFWETTPTSSLSSCPAASRSSTQSVINLTESKVPTCESMAFRVGALDWFAASCSPTDAALLRSRAVSSFQLAYDLASKVRGKDERRRAVLAKLAIATIHGEQQIATAENELKTFPEIHGADNWITVRAAYSLADIQFNEGHYSDALENYNKVLSAKSVIKGWRILDLADTMAKSCSYHIRFNVGNKWIVIKERRG